MLGTEPEGGQRDHSEASPATDTSAETATTETLLGSAQVDDGDLSYRDLVELVEQSGGRLQIELATTDVDSERSIGFPYAGYKLAWVAAMQGHLASHTVRLTTTSVGKKRDRGFPYFGYGYAWAEDMRGQIGANEMTLTVVDVGREKSHRFPYRGYGFAWARELSGRLGEDLEVDLVISDVGRKRGWGFPYFGYGSAWAERGTLTLTLARRS